MAPQRDEKVTELQTFAQRLRQLRAARGWSQRKLAEITGIGTTVLNQYERQLTVPKIDAVQKLAEALDVSVDYLMGRTDIPGSKYLIQVEGIGKAWGDNLLEVLYRGKDLPEDDRETIADIVRKWVERTRREADSNSKKR